MDKATNAGETYCVNVLTPPVSVYAILPNTEPEQRELIKTFDKAGQGYFTAQSGKVVFEGGQVGLVTQVFNAAPAAGGGGGGLTPAEKAAVTSLASGTINSAGSLNVHAASILTYGAPMDTMGGDVYHRDGSATFAGTEGGHNYAASIDFKHFEVRKNGQLIVHFHESNGEPVLELGGERVLTADEREARLMQNGVTRFSFRTWKEVHDYFEQFYVGDTFVCDTTWLGYGYGGFTGSQMTFPYVSKGGVNTPFYKVGNTLVVKPNDGTKRFVLRFAGYHRAGGSYFTPAKADCDFVFVVTGDCGLDVRSGNGLAAKSFTVIITAEGAAGNAGMFDKRMFAGEGLLVYKCDGFTSLPTTDMAWFQGNKGDEQDYSLRCEVSLNSLTTSFHLFDGTNGTKFALTADSVAYTLNSLKTVTNAPTAHFGIDDRCIRAVGEGETADYEYRDGEDGTWGTGALATAVAGAKSRGWLMSPVIVNVTTGPVA